MSQAARKLKVGILGVGSIGQTLAQAIDQKQIEAELVAISDLDLEKAQAFAGTLDHVPAVMALDTMLEITDVVVEAAGQKALLDLVPQAIARGRDVLIMSVGGLLGHQEWFCQAKEKGCRIYVPSGAIAGLDGIKSASVGRIDSAVLTSRKPVGALRGTQFAVDRKLPLDTYKEETVIFEGSAEEAAHAFPTTSNVAASLRLAVDPKIPVRVQVVAVPGGTKNVHQILVQGEFGNLSVSIENVPSKANPRTSQLAAFSAVATLGNLSRSLRVGT